MTRGVGKYPFLPLSDREWGILDFPLNYVCTFILQNGMQTAVFVLGVPAMLAAIVLADRDSPSAQFPCPDLVTLRACPVRTLAPVLILIRSSTRTIQSSVEKYAG